MWKEYTNGRRMVNSSTNWFALHGADIVPLLVQEIISPHFPSPRHLLCSVSLDLLCIFVVIAWSVWHTTVHTRKGDKVNISPSTGQDLFLCFVQLNVK